MNDDLNLAIDMLRENYKRAQESEYIFNPIGWALYHTWKEFDKPKYHKKDK